MPFLERPDESDRAALDFLDRMESTA